MDFLDLVKERYSVRKFDTRKVEKEKLNLILEAGRVAPTAANYQPQRILVIDSDERFEALKRCTPFHFNAPMALIVCYDKSACWKDKRNREAGEVDASIITTHMMLEASNLGIGSTWVGDFEHDVVRKNFNIPEFLEIVAILPLGYPASESKPHPFHDTRFDINHTVFYNSFDKIEKSEERSTKH